MPKARDRLFLTKGAIKLASRTTFLCRCKPFKELFSLYASAIRTEVFRESGCKGTANSATHQIFSQLFFEKSKVFRFLDANQGITMADTLLYIRARDYVRMRKTTFSDLENNIF